MVFTINPLRNVRDEVQMVLDFGFSLLHLVAILPSFHPLFFVLLFGPSHIRPVLPRNFFQLLFLKLTDLILVVVNALAYLLLVLLDHPLVRHKSILFKPVTDS